MCHFSKAHARTLHMLPKKNAILSHDLIRRGQESTLSVVKTKVIVTGPQIERLLLHRQIVDAYRGCCSRTSRVCLKPPMKHTSISLVSRGLSSRCIAKPPITAYWIEFCSKSLVIRSVADVMFATGGAGFSSSSESGSNSILYVSALIDFAPAIVLE